MKGILYFLAVCLLTACGSDRMLTPVLQPLPPASDPFDPTIPYINQRSPGFFKEGPADITRVTARNVLQRADRDIKLLIRELNGALISKQRGVPIVMDDLNSYTFVIHKGVISTAARDMEILMERYVNNYDGCPLKDVRITLSPGRMNMKGKMKQGLWVPFEMEGSPQALPNGLIQLLPDKVVTAGLPVGGLIDLVGIKMDSLVKLDPSKGVTMDGNAVIMDMTKMMPPPAISGKVVRVDVDEQFFTITFDDRTNPPPTPLVVDAPNYLHLYGGRARMVNTFLTHTNLQIVDLDPKDPFDLFLGEYAAQMLAGYIKQSVEGWHVSYQPDYEDMGASTNRW